MTVAFTTFIRLRHLLAPLLVGLCLVSGPTLSSCLDNGLLIEQAQVRATAPNAPVAAGYLRINNQTSRTQTLLSAFAPFSRKAEIHDVKHENGVMKMVRIDGGLVIPDGLTVKLMPRSRHLMFMGLEHQLHEGMKFDITLIFAPCGKIVVPFAVVKKID